MTAAEFAATLEAEATYLDEAARVAGGGFEAGLAAELAARCRELASEARITGAAGFEQLDDRREALARSAAAPPNRGGFRFIPRRRPRPEANPPEADVFDPDTGAGWDHRAARPAAVVAANGHAPAR